MKSIRICTWACLVLACLSSAGSSRAASASRPSSQRLQELAEQQRRSPNQVVPGCRQAFDEWVHEDASNRPLQSFRQRLEALRSLRDRIGTSLKAASAAAADALLDKRPSRGADIPSPKMPWPDTVAPAEQVYAEYSPRFAHGIDTAGLSPAELDFLKGFYNAEVQEMIAQTTRLGLPLVGLDESSYELSYYLLLLPLLHSAVGFDARLLDSLPDREKTSDKLSHMADFCLLRLGRPDAAAAVSLKLSKQEPSPAVLCQYYLDAAAKCMANKLPARAVQCLQQAVMLFEPGDPKAIDLRFRICDTWAADSNYALAAGDAAQIVKDLAGTQAAGKAVYLRLRYLAQQGDFKSVLMHVDDALKENLCKPYEADLIYLKWVSFRKEGMGEQAGSVTRRFLAAFPDSPYCAEMHYAVAMDYLVAQRYDEALQCLQSLVEKYPSSPHVPRARLIIDNFTRLANEKAASSQP